MAIMLRLEEIAQIKRGSSPRPILKWLVNDNDELPWAKISDIKNNEITTTKQFVNKTWLNKGLIGNYNDLFITNSATPGVSFIQKNKNPIAYHDGFLKIIPDQDFVLKKYLFYKLIIDRPKLISLGNGAVFINLSTEILKKWEVKLPLLQTQQKIIDIIEQKNELFLKFPNTVRIDTFEHTKNDLKNLIDIIEPLEILSAKIKSTKKVIISLLKMVANNKVEKTNEPLINHLTFEKGKNGPKEFEREGTPFLDVRTLNTRIPSKFIKDQPNTFKGDILLSLDATVGLVDWFIEGFNGYLYNLKSNHLTKTEILLNVLNRTNKKIIEMNATGSTIKHASKAKKEMLYFKLNHEWKNITNTLFKLLLVVEEIDAKKTKLHQLCVNLLIR